jgi:hypothetical protein
MSADEQAGPAIRHAHHLGVLPGSAWRSGVRILASVCAVFITLLKVCAFWFVVHWLAFWVAKVGFREVLKLCYAIFLFCLVAMAQLAAVLWFFIEIGWVQ